MAEKIIQTAGRDALGAFAPVSTAQVGVFNASCNRGSGREWI